MESSLHRQLKEAFGPALGGQTEVTADGFRADALGSDGEWIEVQSGPLGPLRPKLERLLPAGRQVRIIKPVITERRIVRRARRDGPALNVRRSPRRGSVVDVFDDLVGLARVFPHPGLRIAVLGVAIDEVRVPSRRRRYLVADRSLRAIQSREMLRDADDLWNLLPIELPVPFTTIDLAARLDRPVAFAQRVAYCLRLAGAACVCGKVGNRIVYRRASGRGARSSA
jgi:hypothetical protein